MIRKNLIQILLAGTFAGCNSQSGINADAKAGNTTINSTTIVVEANEQSPNQPIIFNIEWKLEQSRLIEVVRNSSLNPSDRTLLEDYLVQYEKDDAKNFETFIDDLLVGMLDILPDRDEASLRIAYEIAKSVTESLSSQDEMALQEARKQVFIQTMGLVAAAKKITPETTQAVISELLKTVTYWPEIEINQTVAEINEAVLDTPDYATNEEESQTNGSSATTEEDGNPDKDQASTGGPTVPDPELDTKDSEAGKIEPPEEISSFFSQPANTGGSHGQSLTLQILKQPEVTSLTCSELTVSSSDPSKVVAGPVAVKDENCELNLQLQPDQTGNVEVTLIYQTQSETFTITFNNLEPTVQAGAVPTLSPSTAYPSSDLSCIAPTFSDPEGRPLALEYQWTRDSALVSGQTAANYSGSMNAGNQISCSVRALDSLGAASEWIYAVPVTIQPIVPTLDFDASAAAGGAYMQLTPQGLNDTTYRPSVADIDGDNQPDIILNARYGATLAVLFNDSTSDPFTFNSLFFGDPIDNFTDYGYGDFDNDTDVDFIARGKITGNYYLFRQSAPGVFDPWETLTNAGVENSGAIKFVDLDEDGFQDFVVRNGGSDNIHWYRQTAGTSISYTALLSTNQPDNPTDFCIGNLDASDGLDMVVTSKNDDKLWFYANDGSESFTGTELDSSLNDPNECLLVDYDGDTDLDILVRLKNLGIIRLYTNNGAPSFASSDLITGATSIESMHYGDYNQDGRQDFIGLVSNGTAWEIKAWLKNSGAGFTEKLLQTLEGISPRQLDVADFNGDSLEDLLITKTSAGPFESSVILFPQRMNAFTAEPRISIIGPLHTYDFYAQSKAKFEVLFDAPVQGLDLTDFSLIDVGGNLGTVALDSIVHEGHRAVITVTTGTLDAAGNLILRFTNDSTVLGMDGSLLSTTNLSGGHFESASIEVKEKLWKDSNTSILASSCNGYYNDIFFAPMDTTPGEELVYLCSRLDTIHIHTSAGSSTLGNSSNHTDLKDLIAVDLDGNGRLDLLGTSESDGKLFIYFQQTNGSYTYSLIETNATDGPFSVAAAELSGDSRLDIVVGRQAGSGTYFTDVYIKRNDADYTSTGFDKVTLTPGFSVTASTAEDVKIFDIDNDGLLDIVTPANDYLSWWKNNGDNTFTENLITLVEDWIQRAWVGRLSGPGGPVDILTNAPTRSRIIRFTLTDTGSWIRRELNLDQNIGWVRDPEVHDLDGDGDLDLVLGSGNNPVFYWFENDGEENFKAHFISNTASYVDDIWAVSVGDLNIDGNLDIGITTTHSSTSYRTRIYYGQ